MLISRSDVNAILHYSDVSVKGYWPNAITPLFKAPWSASFENRNTVFPVGETSVGHLVFRFSPLKSDNHNGATLFV